MTSTADTTPSDAPRPVRICFVCLGNICRSPTAEAVMADLVEQAGLSDRIAVDSAGTGGWHTGDPADERAIAEAERRGITMASRARQFRAGDFERFDLVVAMDRHNLADLQDLTETPAQHEKIVMLRSFCPEPDEPGGGDVPDPYYGGRDGFAQVFDIIDSACRGLLVHLRATHPER